MLQKKMTVTRALQGHVQLVQGLCLRQRQQKHHPLPLLLFLLPSHPSRWQMLQRGKMLSSLSLLVLCLLRSLHLRRQMWLCAMLHFRKLVLLRPKKRKHRRRHHYHPNHHRSVGLLSMWQLLQRLCLQRQMGLRTLLPPTRLVRVMVGQLLQILLLCLVLRQVQAQEVRKQLQKNPRAHKNKIGTSPPPPPPQTPP